MFLLINLRVLFSATVRNVWPGIEFRVGLLALGGFLGCEIHLRVGLSLSGVLGCAVNLTIVPSAFFLVTNAGKECLIPGFWVTCKNLISYISISLNKPTYKNIY